MTDAEKLMMLMVCEMYRKIVSDGEYDPDFISAAVFTGNTWALKWKFDTLDSEQKLPGFAAKVGEILSMWLTIERSFEQLSEPDRKKLEAEAAPFGKDPRFEGFDGNNESDYRSVAKFMVGPLGLYEEFQGRDLNSHSPKVRRYTAMLTKYNSMEPDVDKRFLSRKQLKQLLTVRVTQ